MSPYSRFAPRSAAVVAALLFAAGVLAACGPTISKFNETAYEQATSLKVESVALMNAATEPYEQHADDVRALKKKLEKAHEYAKGRPNNEISAKQWNILISPNRNLLGGFLKRWKDDSSLNKVFVKEKVKQVRDAFDTIIGLESGKIKPKDVKEAQ